MSAITDLTVTAADGTPTSLVAWRGKVLLIINTASKCGFTPQYEGEIASFCSLTYDVTFPLFAKVEVNGEGAAPLFERLKADAPGVMGTRAIKWNFTKFLVDRDGRTIRRYAPTTKPADIRRDIDALL